MAEVLTSNSHWPEFRKGGTSVKIQLWYWLKETSVFLLLFLYYSASCFLLWIVVKRWRRGQSKVLLNCWGEANARRSGFKSQWKARVLHNCPGKIARNKTHSSENFTFTECWHWTAWPSCLARRLMLHRLWQRVTVTLAEKQTRL